MDLNEFKKLVNCLLLAALVDGNDLACHLGPFIIAVGTIYSIIHD